VIIVSVRNRNKAQTVADGMRVVLCMMDVCSMIVRAAAVNHGPMSRGVIERHRAMERWSDGMMEDAEKVTSAGTTTTTTTIPLPPDYTTLSLSLSLMLCLGFPPTLPFNCDGTGKVETRSPGEGTVLARE
jgi:hypothetical protein